MVSLSLRLFGNILGEDSLIAAFVGLGILALSFIHSPIGLPIQLPFFLLSMLLGTIQALVFTLLTTIYISLMLPHEAPGPTGREARREGGGTTRVERVSVRPEGAAPRRTAKR